MLIEFSVENYKSFRDRTTFSMVAANLTSADKRLDENNTIPVSDSLRLLTSAAIYGKNASGKSNLGLAMKFMRSLVLDSASKPNATDDLFRERFRLNTRTKEEPCSFEMVFYAQGNQYRYGFEADENRIASEWLYYVPSRREYALFEREGQSIAIRNGFREARGLEERTRQNSLFLSVVAQFNGPTARLITHWFNLFTVASGLEDGFFQAFTASCLREGTHKDDIVEFVRGLDVDIADLIALEPPDITMPGASAETMERVHSELNNYVWAQHPVYNERGQVVSYDELSVNYEESQGTRKLIAMAGPLYDTLTHGRTLFIDEMDARLHTEITQAIVRLFNSKETNPKGAQLIFVTHDTNLLDNRLFRRDQIWFAEKDRPGATHLTALSEFNERNTADFERRYLGGRYGGLPSLGDLRPVAEAAPHG